MPKKKDGIKTALPEKEAGQKIRESTTMSSAKRRRSVTLLANTENTNFTRVGGREG
jgi:hypothetical protein